MQREGIELVGEEDFGKSLITRAKSNIRARRQVDTYSARTHMDLPIGGHGLQTVHGYVGARTGRTRCAGTVRRLGSGRVGPSRQPAFLVFELILA